MKILLLSAYDAASHRHWHEQLRGAFPGMQWTLLSLPPRHFSWRLRGNSLSWAFNARETLEQDYDLVLATSMVDLSTLRGLVPALSRIPTVVYFHENQYAYPDSGHQVKSVEPRLLNLYTALAADRVVFNSAYNRDTFLRGATALLARFPDHVPAGLVDTVEKRSEVIPVPLAEASFQSHQPTAGAALELVWNHRWEYDKGPDRLLAIVRQLDAAAIPATLHVVGQQFRRRPEAFDAVRRQLDNSQNLRAGRWGFIENGNDYQALLRRSDVVLSTAMHDFQGLAVLEAVAAGCIPIVPDRLCYPEWFDDQYRYPSFPDDPEQEARGVLGRLQTLQQQKCSGLPAAPCVKAFGMASLRECYDALFAEMAKTAPSQYHRRPARRAVSNRSRE